MRKVFWFDTRGRLVDRVGWGERVGGYCNPNHGGRAAALLLIVGEMFPTMHR